jgi:hypothetical protein
MGLLKPAWNRNNFRTALVPNKKKALIHNPGGGIRQEKLTGN